MKKSIHILMIAFMVTICTAQEYHAGDHELLLMPTAYTMEAGKSYLSDYELFFLNYTYAVTPSTHLGIFTLFPITKDFLETFTLGAKQKYLDSGFIKAALWTTYTPKISGLTLGTVFSFGKAANGLHIGISTATEFETSEEHWEFVYMLGYRYDLSQKFSLLAEYTNFSSFIEEDFNGLISIGIRFRGESIAWELAGVRPLESTGDFLFFPLLKATFLFD